MSHINTHIEQHIGTITLNRSHKKNAFNDAMLEQGIAAFEAMANADVRVVVLRAENGLTVWSAGRDVHSLPKTSEDIPGWHCLLTAFGKAIRNCPVPVIAQIEGSVWGYACEVVFSCDLIVATPDANFAITPGKLGVAYDINGINTLLQRLGPAISKEMLFSAQNIRAERLYALGVINHLIAANQMDKHITKMAMNIANLAPLSIAAIKQQITDLSNNAALTPELIAANAQRDKMLFNSKDFQEGLNALVEKRKPVFYGK